jgi:hypothetical protein
MDTDRLQHLCDERDVERTLNLFARAMDDRDWTVMAEILADDAEGDFGTGRLHGSAAIIELIRGFLGSCGPTNTYWAMLSSMSTVTLRSAVPTFVTFISTLMLTPRRGSIRSATTRTHGSGAPTGRGA